MCYVENSVSEYTECFPLDWIDKLDWTEDKKIDSLRSGSDKIEAYADLIFEQLWKSALTGEYITEGEKVKRVLSELLDLCTTIEYTSDSQNQEQERLLYAYMVLNEDLAGCLKAYLSLLSLIEDKLERDEHDWMFNIYYSSKAGNGGNSQLRIFTKFVIPLCKADHMLSYAEDSIKSLIIMRHELQSYKKKDSNVILDILMDKASFLLKKMLHVKKSDKAEYSLDFKQYVITKDDIKLDNLKIFDDKFEFLHKNQICSLRERAQWEVRVMVKNEINTSDVILLMTYYQSLEHSLSDINALIERYVEFYKQKQGDGSLCLFDKYSLDLVINYLYNCRFSYKIKNGVPLDEFYADLDEIQGLQRKTVIFNFFPYRKAILFLKEKWIEPLMRKDAVDIEKLNLLLEKLEYYIAQYKKALKWCENMYFYPFQLAFCDSKVHYEGCIDVFYPSTFTRPMRYDELKEDLEKFNALMLNYKTKFDLMGERSKLEEVKFDIRQAESKNVKTLGLFTSVVTFLFGSVNIFTTGKSFKEVIGSTMALGVLLLLFCSLLYFLLLPPKKNFVQMVTDVKFIVFGLFSLIFMIILFKTVC